MKLDRKLLPKRPYHRFSKGPGGLMVPPATTIEGRIEQARIDAGRSMWDAFMVAIAEHERNGGRT